MVTTRGVQNRSGAARINIATRPTDIAPLTTNYIGMMVILTAEGSGGPRNASKET